MFSVLTLSGGALLALGTVFLYWMKKRKFDRTNSAGIEQFRSFGIKLKSVFFDGFLGWLALLCNIAGVLLLAWQFQDSWGWIILLPVTAFLLLVFV